MKDFKKNYLIFLIIAACFVAGIGVFSYSKFNESHMRGELSEKSHVILKNVSVVRAFVFQGLNEHKRYRVTGKPEDLDIYNQNKDIATGIISNIISETANSSSQNRRAKEIQKNFINLTDAVQSQPLGKYTDNKTVQERLAALIEDIDAFSRSEDRIFEGRLESLIALNRNFYIAVVIGTFAAFALLMYMNYYLLLAQNREAVMQRKFEELKERQAQSFQATKDGLFEWKFQDHSRDTDTTSKMYWSPRLKEMIGYEDSELTASADTLEQLMHPEDRDIFWQELHKHLRGEIPGHSTFFRWKHKNGNWIWINARGRALFNEFGEATKLIGVHTDVTKLKEYELQLAKSKDEAEKANSAKSDFLAHMSHEIRTPLTAVTGVAEILNMQKTKFDEKTQKLMAALNASAIGLRDLISDILDFSKIESGKIVLEDKEIDLHEFFESLNMIMSVRSSEKKLNFECDYTSIDGLKISGDRTRLHQILINLIGNAVKFTNAGSVKVLANVITSNEKELLQVEVADTGIGIAEEHLPHIFESFRQADASVSRKYGGTGLGLPIARHLAQLMGGNIYVTSRIGEGSTFTLYVPLTRSHVNVDDRPKRETKPLKPFFAPDDKILVVEDYEGNIAFITHILDEMGVKYDLGRTGLEGLKLWDENKYRMILMDIQMPEMDGISAVKHIRTKEREMDKKPVPIIAMTAHAFSEDREKCLKAGFDEYLPKPLSKDMLFEKMSGLMRHVKVA